MNNSIEEEEYDHSRGERISLPDRDFHLSGEESIGRSVEESPAIQSHRVIVLGGAEVGKTVLLHKFLSQDSYESEKGETIAKLPSIIKSFHCSETNCEQSVGIMLEGVVCELKFSEKHQMDMVRNILSKE